MADNGNLISLKKTEKILSMPREHILPTCGLTQIEDLYTRLAMGNYEKMNNHFQRVRISCDLCRNWNFMDKLSKMLSISGRR